MYDSIFIFTILNVAANAATLRIVLLVFLFLNRVTSFYVSNYDYVNVENVAVIDHSPRDVNFTRTFLKKI